MYKLIIAEDEAIVRNGILHAIDWKDIGFEICGAAEDGLEALELIRQYAPDVLVTDIKMPGMTGLELLHALNAEKRQIRAVILTGYADFEYARKAIQERAVGYVLKMDVVEELPKVMRRLKAELDQLAQPDAYAMMEELRRKTTISTDAVLDGLRGSTMEQAVAFVLEHYTERLRMEDVAQRFYMNPAYFSRAFKQKTGEGFSEMTNRLRMNWAKELLENSAMRVADVARATGYIDLKHFTAQFKKHFNKTPSQCRDEAKQQENQ